MYAAPKLLGRRAGYKADKFDIENIYFIYRSGNRDSVKNYRSAADYQMTNLGWALAGASIRRSIWFFLHPADGESKIQGLCAGLQLGHHLSIECWVRIATEWFCSFGSRQRGNSQIYTLQFLTG